MTSAYRSGMRMGYWNTSSLNLDVTERKLKSLRLWPRLSAQIFSSAGTIGAMSVPGSRKPCRGHHARVLTQILHQPSYLTCNLGDLSQDHMKQLYCQAERNREMLVELRSPDVLKSQGFSILLASLM